MHFLLEHWICVFLPPLPKGVRVWGFSVRAHFTNTWNNKCGVLIWSVVSLSTTVCADWFWSFCAMGQ